MKTPHSIKKSNPDHSGRTAAEIQEWIIGRLSEELRVSRDKIKADEPILGCGIDSVQVVSLMANLEDWGEFRFPEDPLDSYPTPESLAQFVANLTRTPT